MSSQRGRRAGVSRSEQREGTLAEIKRASRSLLVTKGAEAVRLRAIARALGLTAPALYRYVASHEELMRLLTEDIYDELTATVEHAEAAAAGRAADETTGVTCGTAGGGTAAGGAVGGMPAEDVAGLRLYAAARTFRRWALDHPREFGLVFANPIPPMPERGGPRSSRLRFAAVFSRIFVDLWNSKPFPVPPDGDLSEQVRRELEPTARELLPGLPVGAAYVFVWCWARLYGAVCLEVFGHLSWAFDDGAHLFEQMLSELRERTSAPS